MSIIHLVEDPPEGRVHGDNPNNELLRRPARPILVELGRTESCQDEFRNVRSGRSFERPHSRLPKVQEFGTPFHIGVTQPGDVVITRHVSGFDGSPDNVRGEHGLQKFSQVTNLERIILEDLREYGAPGRRGLYRWVENTQVHGLSGLAEFDVIDPHEWVGYDAAGRETFAAGEVRRLVPCLRQEKERKAWCDACRSGKGQMCLSPVSVIIPHRELLHRPLDIFREEERLDILRLHLEAAHGPSVDEVGDPVPDWDGEESIEEMEARLERAEGRRQDQDVHLDRDALPDLEDSPDEEFVLDVVSLSDCFESSNVARELERLSRPGVPRNLPIFMGATEDPFMDHWDSQWHPLRWLVQLFISFARLSPAELRRGWSWLNMRKDPPDPQAGLRARMARWTFTALSEGIPAELESWQVRFLARAWDILDLVGKDDLKGLWADDPETLSRIVVQIRERIPEGDPVLAKEWAVRRRRRLVSKMTFVPSCHLRKALPLCAVFKEGFRKPDGTLVPEGWLFPPQVRIPFASRLSYLRWRLEELHVPGIPLGEGAEQEFLPLKEAWPFLHEALSVLLERMGRPGDLDEAVIEALRIIDLEHAAWRREWMGRTVWSWRTQPILEETEEVLHRLRKELADEGWESFSAKDREISFQGRSVSTDRFGEAGAALGRLWSSGQAVREDDFEPFRKSWNQAVGQSGQDSREEATDRLRKAVFRQTVRQAWREAWDLARCELRPGLVLPDGTDLQHSSPVEMLRSPHIRILGPRTAAAAVAAIMRRRMTGHFASTGGELRWHPGLRRSVRWREALGIHTVWDILDLDIEMSQARDFQNPKTGEEDVLILPPVRTTLFRRDSRTADGRWGSSQLSLLTCTNPEKVGRRHKSLVQAYMKSWKELSRLPLMMEGAALLSAQGLATTDHQALRQAFEALRRKLDSLLELHKA